MMHGTHPDGKADDGNPDGNPIVQLEGILTRIPSKSWRVPIVLMLLRTVLHLFTIFSTFFLINGLYSAYCLQCELKMGYCVRIGASESASPSNICFFGKIRAPRSVRG